MYRNTCFADTPLFVLMLTYGVTTRIVETWPECQDKKPWLEFCSASTAWSPFLHHLVGNLLLKITSLN